MEAKTILLVDDDASVLRATARYLRAIGYKNILEAHNPEEGLRVFAENRGSIVAIMTDGEMDNDKEAGFKFIAAIREQDNKIPMAMLSATEEREVIIQKKLKDAGGANFIDKSSIGKSAMDLVEEWLNSLQPGMKR